MVQLRIVERIVKVLLRVDPESVAAGRTEVRALFELWHNLELRGTLVDIIEPFKHPGEDVPVILVVASHDLESLLVAVETFELFWLWSQAMENYDDSRLTGFACGP